MQYDTVIAINKMQCLKLNKTNGTFECPLALPPCNVKCELMIYLVNSFYQLTKSC